MDVFGELSPVSSRGHLNSSFENVFQFGLSVACFRCTVREFCNNKILPLLSDIIILDALTYFSTGRNYGEHNNLFPIFSLEKPYIAVIPILVNTDSSERNSSTKETHSLTRTDTHTHFP
jgi:hypothetical protein